MKGTTKTALILGCLLVGVGGVAVAFWWRKGWQELHQGELSQPLPPAENLQPAIVPTVPDVQIVTGEALGLAELCLTGNQLRERFPNLVFEPYQGQGPLVDTEGVTARDRAGELEFYALAVTGEGPKLDVLVTNNPSYKTREGVGPGTAIAEATLHYGAARLSYNINNESREFVAFQYGPKDILFRTGSGAEAGIYESSGEYNETDRYQEGATIREVWILARGCG